MDGDFERQRTRRRGSRAATVTTFAALAALVVAPLIAGALPTGTPAALLRLPAESIAVVLILLLIPGRRLRAFVAGAFGLFVTLAILVAALDLGFRATIDRAFNPAEDWPAVFSAIGVVGDSVGVVNAVLIVVLLVTVLVAAGVTLVGAALRARQVTARSGRTGQIAITAVTVMWILGALAGAQVLPGVPLAAADSTAVLVTTTAHAAQSLRDRQEFERVLASDPLHGPADELLTGLEGKDVVIAFLESYGKVAVQHAPYTVGVAEVLREGGAQLTDDGYSARSAFLTSPTFGGVSWLAHSTLQSGVWVDSPQKYDWLTSAGRLTLTRAFADAGWRTVAVVPSNTKPWPQGESFYGYDAILDMQNMGYDGPRFSYARIPDQYTWKIFHDRELSGVHAPVMAEIDFVSSHGPWTPLPRLVPWEDADDAAVFETQPADQPEPAAVWGDPQKVQALYGQSLEYTLGAMFSYLHTYDQPNLVLVLLGDHQPGRIVSGPDADHDVPVTIISKDAAVFDRIASWLWEPGVHPSPDAPVWRMDEFRDRFVDAFTY